MFIKNAHLQIIRSVRDLMQHDIAYEDALLATARSLPCRQFRPVVAVRALTFLSWKVGRMLVPQGKLTEEKFCEQVAIGIACTAEKDRPSYFSKYAPGQFAHALLERFMRSYCTLDDLGFPDEEMREFTLVEEDIPTDPHAELRNFVRQTDLSTFGHYTLPNEVHLFNEPESS